MICRCTGSDFDTIYAIINDAATAYKGVIPPDCWHEPYMSKEELRNEINSGVVFWCHLQQNIPVGVMGIQDVQDVALFRHAYVRTTMRNQGIGGRLLTFLSKQTKRPVLVGTWAAAVWAVGFYQKHGFRLVTDEEKNRLLGKYWSIRQRQIETSVVLADEKWFEQNRE